MKYYIANWKTNKTLKEAQDWMQFFLEQYSPQETKTIVICPPLPFIYPLQRSVAQHENIFIGVQDISKFEKGTYTGEVSALNLAEFVDFTIINHSERSIHFNETSHDSFLKSKIASKYNLKRFYCIRNPAEDFPHDVEFVCYEPIESISTGNGEGKNKPLKEIIDFKHSIRLEKHTQYIYGGSINENNIQEYLLSTEIDGFLIGGASLDPKRFIKIINS